MFYEEEEELEVVTESESEAKEREKNTHRKRRDSFKKKKIEEDSFDKLESKKNRQSKINKKSQFYNGY